MSSLSAHVDCDAEGHRTRSTSSGGLTPLSSPSGSCNENAGHGQMMDVEASYSDFINCDRTGRRNAVPDITREGGQAPASTSELAKDMAEMDLKAAGEVTCTSDHVDSATQTEGKHKRNTELNI